MDDMEFTNSNIGESILDIYNRLDSTIKDAEILLTLPIDFVKSKMTHKDFNNYLKLRSRTIDLLNLLEVYVFDTHEEETKCFECNETVAKIVTRRMNGREVEKINGEIEHWVTNGMVHHIFICEECLKKQRQQNS